MKLKHVFFSTLLMSVGFTACTNDELVEVVTPSKPAGDYVALGQGYTISVSKAIPSRAIFDEKLNTTWEEYDEIGAAWRSAVTSFDENNIVTGVANLQDKFYSNHRFALVEGAGTASANFKYNDYAMAGAYVLYYPYNEKITNIVDKIPVYIDNFDFDTENPTYTISNNMFAYSNVAFVPGGSQVSEFTLNQLPVLYALKFKADKSLNMNLDGGVVINNIIFRAYDKAGNSLLRKEGWLAPNGNLTVEDYNEGNLDAIVKYQSASDALEMIYSNVKGGDKEGYRIDALDENFEDKKAFYFSALPLSSDKVEKVEVKVVTNKGVFAKEYTRTKNQSIIEAIAGKASQEGGQVSLNVTLNVSVADSEIFTADEFIKRWQSVQEGKSETLNVAVPLDLQGYDLKSDKNITVIGKPLSGINSIDIKNVTIENDLTVSGNVILNDNSKVKNIIIDGNLTTEGKVTLNGETIVKGNFETNATKDEAGIISNATVVGKINVNGTAILGNGTTFKEVSEFNDNATLSGVLFDKNATFGGTLNILEGDNSFKGTTEVAGAFNLKGNSNIKYAKALNVKGNVVTSNTSVLNATSFAAMNATINGAATLYNVNVTKKFVAAMTSKITLNGKINAGNLDIQKGAAAEGKLIINGATLENVLLTNNGSVEVVKNSIISENATVEILSGKFSTNENTNLVNKGIININTDTDNLQITNDGTINVNATYTVNKNLVNNEGGIVNVNKTLYFADKDNKALLTNEGAIYAEGSVSKVVNLPKSSNPNEGYLYISKDANLDGSCYTYIRNIAYRNTAKSIVPSQLTKVQVFFVGNLSETTTVKASRLNTIPTGKDKTVIFNNVDLVLDADLALSTEEKNLLHKFVGKINVTTTLDAARLNLGHQKTHIIEKGGELIIGNKVTLGKDANNSGMGVSLDVYGALKVSDGGNIDNVKVNYKN